MKVVKDGGCKSTFLTATSCHAVVWLALDMETTSSSLSEEMLVQYYLADFHSRRCRTEVKSTDPR